MKKIFQIAITGLVFNTGLLPAISPIVVDYQDAKFAQAIDRENDSLCLSMIKYNKFLNNNYMLDLVDNYLRHPLLDAIAEGNTKKVISMLQEGCDFYEIKQAVIRINSEGINHIEEERAMQVAIKYSPNSFEMVELLLSAGIDPDETYIYEKRLHGNEEVSFSTYETPLSLAIKYKKQELLDLLQDFRVEVDQENESKEKSYKMEFSDRYFRHPLIEIIKKGWLNIAEEVIKKGTDLNNISQGVIRSDKKGNKGIFEEEGILQVAIKYAPNAFEAVKLLLDNGLDPKQNQFKYIPRDEFLKSDPQFFYLDPIDLAIDCQQFEVLELLSN